MSAKQKPVCSVCKEPLNGTRLVLEERWFCADCVYEVEYWPAKRAARPTRRRRLHPQSESLFPLPPAG